MAFRRRQAAAVVQIRLVFGEVVAAATASARQAAAATVSDRRAGQVLARRQQLTGYAAGRTVPGGGITPAAQTSAETVRSSEVGVSTDHRT